MQVSVRGEVTVALPPRLELRCPPLAVANRSLEITLVSWGAVGVDVDWKITKDDVQVAKGEIQPLHLLDDGGSSVIVSNDSEEKEFCSFCFPPLKIEIETLFVLFFKNLLGIHLPVVSLHRKEFTTTGRECEAYQLHVTDIYSTRFMLGYNLNVTKQHFI